MKYIYVFDYCLGHIYEIPISNKEYNKNLSKIFEWLYKNYHLKYENIHYMISNKKLEIETIEQIEKH